MEVRIGLTQVPKELEIDLGDDVDGSALSADIEKAVESGSGVLWLTDKRGRKTGVPVAKLAYVEIGPHGDGHRVGFGVPSVPASARKK
jgi:hypothetical protein